MWLLLPISPLPRLSQHETKHTWRAKQRTSPSKIDHHRCVSVIIYFIHFIHTGYQTTKRASIRFDSRVHFATINHLCVFSRKLISSRQEFGQIGKIANCNSWCIVEAKLNVDNEIYQSSAHVPYKYKTQRFLHSM